MNISLFVAQLNQLLQGRTMAACEDVCDLLRAHTHAAVTVTNQSSQVVVELLQPNNTKSGDVEHCLGLPIMAGDSVIGNISLCRFGDAFSKEENLALGIAISVCTIMLRQQDTKLIADKQRRREGVRNLINTLSFSELEAATEILKELEQGGKNEGLLVAGHIADRLGFTRSVVTAALKKLEGASLIETRSLGMKGTFIKVKDLLLVEELGKL
ncbi:MAG: hypothetical protein FWC32_07655 [Firmicutes bacterium]|nr:hypothetical protein [Bacillota bacterium]